MRTLTIATYNFLAGGSSRRSAHWSMLQTHLEPDILLTQEARPRPTKGRPPKTNLWAEAAAGRWGTGMFARKHVVRPIDVEGFAGWVTGGELDATASITGQPVRIFSVHCPAGQHGYIRTMHEMLDRLKVIADGADLVLGGDFNVAVGFRGPDEAVKMSKAEKNLLDRFAEELDLMPCWQSMHAGPLAQTLRWTGNRSAPYHCDGIFAPRSWRDRLESCEIISGPEWDALSDHNPVVAVFNV